MIRHISILLLLSLAIPCDEGYTEIDGECYYQSDLDVLQQFIDNSQDSFLPPPHNMSPIDVGVQEWENGRIVFFCYTYMTESECPIGDYVLGGHIPPDIGNLVELRYLMLCDSQLSGQIPSSIGNLTNLTEIYLRKNQLSGEIPSEMWNLVNLERLYLEYNDLSGEISESIDNLVNLKYFNLKYNRLSGQIPQSIGNFDLLTNLSFARNQLSGIIPDSICNLVENRNNIYLYGNQLCPPYPECLTEEEINGSWQTGGGEADEQDTSECPPECDLGDVNCDGEINVLDIVIAANIILLNEYDELADVNGDGMLNILDLVTLVNWALYVDGTF